MNGRFYVFGAGKGINFVEEYDPATSTWTSRRPKPTQTGGPTAVVYNNKIYVFGNWNSNGSGTDAVEAYNPDTDIWETVTHMPKKLGSPAITVVGDKAYVIGGALMIEGQFVAISDDVSIYDFNTTTWISSTDSKSGLSPLPHPRIFSYNSAAPVVDGKVYLIGGIECTSAEVCLRSNKVDIYDTVSNTWEAGTALPTPTSGHLSVVLNDQIYVVGGNLQEGDGGETAAVWSIDINSSPLVM